MPEQQQASGQPQQQVAFVPPEKISVDQVGVLEAKLQLPSNLITPAILLGLRHRMMWILNSLSSTPVPYQKWLGVMADVYQIAEDAFCPPPPAVLEQDRVQLQTAVRSREWMPGDSMDEVVVDFYWKAMNGIRHRLMDLLASEGSASLRAEIATICALPLVCPDQECGYWFHGFAVRGILWDAMRQRGICDTLDTRFLTSSQASILGYCIKTNENAIALPYFHVSKKGLGNVELQGADWEGEGAAQIEPRVMHVWHASQVAGLSAQKINYCNTAALEGLLRSAEACESYPMDWDKKYGGEEAEGALARWMVDGFLDGVASQAPDLNIDKYFNAAVQSAAIDIIAARLAVQLRGVIIQTPEQVENRVRGVWDGGYGAKPSDILDSSLYLLRSNTLARLAEMWLASVAPQMSQTWQLWRKRQFEECVVKPFDVGDTNLETIKERIKLGIYNTAASEAASEQQKCLNTGLLRLDELFNDLSGDISGSRAGFLQHWAESVAKKDGEYASAGVVVAGEICSSNEVSELSKLRAAEIYDKCDSAINAFIITTSDEVRNIAKKILGDWRKRDIDPKAGQLPKHCGRYFDWLEIEMLAALEDTGVPFGYDKKTGKWNVAAALDALEQKYLLLPHPYNALDWIKKIYERESERAMKSTTHPHKVGGLG
ncbi:MAG: hypothetical protein IKZ87_04075 [Actinomycetaceae bacterium]|nr:hypothetical protein [Actinomycetaceae bacterium]